MDLWRYSREHAYHYTLHRETHWTRTASLIPCGIGYDRFELLKAFRITEMPKSWLERLHHAARIVHQGVTQIYNLGRGADRDELLVSREYVDGVDLQTLLATTHERCQAIPIPALADLAIGLCTALDAIHRGATPYENKLEIGLGHGALHLRNLFVTRKGGVKIADLACSAFDVKRATTDGTPAPTHAEDRYALGRLLIELFDVDAPAELRRQLWQLAHPETSQRPSDIAVDALEPYASGDPNTLANLVASVTATDPLQLDDSR